MNIWGSFVIGLLGLLVSLWTLIFPISAIEKKIQDMQYDFQKVYNLQTEDTSKFTGEDLIKKYYSYLNSADFQNACSLLSIRMCSMYDVKEFTDWVKSKSNYLTVKLRDGEKLEKIWFSWQRLENTQSEIWCAKIKFKMNYEAEEIDQIWQYTIAIRPDGNKEIRRSLCEYAGKKWENRSDQMSCNTNPKFCVEKKGFE